MNDREDLIIHDPPLIRWVCARNGELTRCQVCRRMVPHHAEELTYQFARPRSGTHDEPMVAT